MAARRLDHAGRGIEPGDGPAEPRRRLRQEPRTAADIEHREPVEREGRAHIASEMAAGLLADIGEPDRVDPVQRPHRAGRIPPIPREAIELVDLAAHEGGGAARGAPTG